jgi:hypothetical protein
MGREVESMSILQKKRSLVKAKVYGLLMHFGREKPILWFWKLKGQNVDYLERPKLAERFETIYKNNVWTERRPGESTSGHGSTTLATQQLVKELPDLLEKIGAESLVDLGCGTYLWMRNVNLRPLYIGVDIVASVIEDNKNRY